MTILESGPLIAMALVDTHSTHIFTTFAGADIVRVNCQLTQELDWL